MLSEAFLCLCWPVIMLNVTMHAEYRSVRSMINSFRLFHLSLLNASKAGDNAPLSLGGS
jgi:hypothetical protein